MNTARRILPLLIVFGAMVAWTQPVAGARLAEVKGTAGSSEVQDTADFKLSEQSAVKVNYNNTKAGDNCAVQIKVYREQNGRWLVVNTVLRSSGSSQGNRSLTLPPGSYRIKVSATDARYHVSVDN